MLPQRIKSYRVAGAVFLTAISAYLLFPAARYNFDGVACAIAVELGDLKYLVHGNHLAYAFLGYLFSSLFRVFGVSIPAIFTLQVFSSLLGAGAAAIFSFVLLECGIDSFIAALGAIGLAMSKIYWIWSLEAQVYPLGAFFVFWAAYEAFRPNPRPVQLGLLHAGAVLGHVGHLMFFPAAWYLLKNRKPRIQYCATLAGTVFLAYAVAGVFIEKPGSLEQWRVWLLGSAALNVSKEFAWHGGYSWTGLKDWLWLTLTMTGLGVLGSLALIAGAGIETARMKAKKRIVTACWLWLAGYAILFLSWEPHTPVYRITDLAPLWLLAALAIERIPWKREIKIASFAACIAILGGWNLMQEIIPASDPVKNADLQRVLWVGRQTPFNAWMIVDGIDQVYVPYFAGRRPINLRYYQDRVADLLRRVESLSKAGEPVFFVPQALSELWQQRLLPHSSLVARSGTLELRQVVDWSN